MTVLLIGCFRFFAFFGVVLMLVALLYDGPKEIARNDRLLSFVIGLILCFMGSIGGWKP